MDRRSFLNAVCITDRMSTSADALADVHPDSINSTLAPWTPSASQPWDVHTINHLFRRVGFTATMQEIKDAKLKSPSEVIDDLLSDAAILAPTVPPEPTNTSDWLLVPPYTYSDFSKKFNDYMNALMKIRCHWTAQMNQPRVMLRERMVLFWMNHFVIEAKKVFYPQMCYNYLTYMRHNPWGNFKQMVRDVTTAPAMLYYLDGAYNKGVQPNENYARELQELLTMGVLDKEGNPNYSQDDIVAVAHSLTGWMINYQAPAPDILATIYLNNQHDQAPQKIYDGIPRVYNLTGSGAAMEKDVIDQMFEKRGDQIAWHICSKIYMNFVNHRIVNDNQKVIIEQLAVALKKNWIIKDVLELLLKSEHFFDEENIGASIKSPYDHLLGIIRSFDLPFDELRAGTLSDYATAASQMLLDPPNVFGWPGHHTWISTTTLPYRNHEIVTPLLIGKNLSGTSSADGYGNNYIPLTLSDDQISAWAKQFANYSGTFDNFLIDIANYLCAHPPTAKALSYIKSKLPPNTYEWAALKDIEKIGSIRIMSSEIMLLADYQLQ